MSENKGITSKILFLRITAVMIFIVLVLFLPTKATKASNPNLSGVQVGGWITGFNPGYPWTLGGFYSGYCQPHVYITVITPLIYAGEIAIRLPPFIPRLSYNYTTPGLAYIGAYYPIMTNFFPAIGCPYDFVPVYFGTWFGTSLIPGK